MSKENEQENIYRTLIECSPDWLMWMGNNQSIKYISPVVKKITGYDAEDFLENPDLVKQIIHPEEKETMNYAFEEEQADHHSGAIEFRIIHKNGEICWIEHYCQAVFDENNKIVGRIISNRDITSKKYLEQKLLKMVRIVEHSAESVIITDVKGRIEYVNSVFERISGYLSKDVIGKNLEMFKSGLHSEAFYKELWDTITHGRIWRGSFKNRKKNGEVLHENAVVFPVIDDTGNIINYAKLSRDMTQQKEMEDSLCQQQELLRTLINSAPDIICFKDGEGRWLEANKADLQLFQLDGVDYRGKKDSDLAKYSDFYYDAFMACEDSDEIAWEKKAISRNIEIIPRPDGSEKVFDVIKTPIFNEDGTRKGLVVLGRDISEMKKTEEALKESENKYRETSKLFRLMSDNMPDLLWAKDLESKFLFVNKAVCEKLLMAKNTDEPIGKDDMFFANRQRSQHPERTDWFTFGELCINSDECTLKANKSMRFDEFGLVQGEFLYLNVNKSPFFDEHGQVIGTIGNGRIVTKEKEIEKKLIESEKRYRRIFEESQDVVFERLIGGYIMDINPAGLNLFGYSSLEEIQKTGSSWDSYVCSEDRKEYLAAIRLSGFVKDYELRLKKKDGSEIIVLETSTAVYDDHQNIIAIRGIMRDITEKRRLEKQLSQIQKMESIGTLAGGVAHDFNNLLTVINGYSEMALMQMDAANPLLGPIEAILRAGKRAKILTSQLLAFSRKQIYKAEIVNINQVISSIEQMLLRLIGEDIQVDTILPENLPLIKADRSQLEQIFVNLMVNARDAIRSVTNPDFPKKITVETGLVDLDKSFVDKHPGSAIGKHVFFAVSDNGVGMNEETKSKIFEPFFTTKEKYKGTGLGLSMIYGIVKQNHGAVFVYSKPGKGTMFKIYWPVTQEKIELEQTGDDKEILRGTERILVVEDEEEVCRFASESLMSLGYRVHRAANGRLALDLMKTEHLNVDLILTDLIMPQLNGKEFIDEVKKTTPAVKVIYVSGYTDSHIVHNGLLENGVNFLHKPYSIKMLAHAVRSILDQK